MRGASDTFDHPLVGAGVGITRGPLWFGPEVEGHLRHTAVHTAFISRALNVPDTLKVARMVRSEEVGHIFLTEIFDGTDNWGWFEQHILPLQAHLRGLITIARFGSPGRGVEEVLEKPWSAKVSLMVRAGSLAPWMAKLRPHDQVSVGVPYQLTTWRVQDGVATVPADYEADKL